MYDAVGNILQMVHKIGATPEWTRNYKYEVDGSDNPISNRLMATSAFADEGDFSATYGYDEHGNMVSMPHLSTVAWNHRDEMASADLGGGGVVYFTYDSAGQRVRKVYEHSGLVEERIYLGGFEIYRKWVVPTGLPKELTLERETLHVMDGEQRIALVETKTVDTSISSYTPETVVRLQLGNHLGSAALEVDLTGAVISYEEYHPYGTTAYQSASGAVEVSRKRYRYTGKERDDETGLYYHGARYYAPWLGRWTAADPAGLVDGLGLYVYVSDNSVVHNDPSGTEKKFSSYARPAEKRQAEAFARGEAPASITFADDSLVGQPPARTGETTVAHVRQGRVATISAPPGAVESRDAVDPDMASRYTGDPREPDPEEPRWVEERFPEHPRYSHGVPYQPPPIDPPLFDLAMLVVPTAVGKIATRVPKPLAPSGRAIVRGGSAPDPVPISPPGEGQILYGSRVGRNDALVFAGHGREPKLTFTVPDDVDLLVPELHVHGGALDDFLGRQLEEFGEVVHGGLKMKYYPPGSEAPNLILTPPTEELNIILETSTTVTAPTLLSDMLKPGMKLCVWGACRIPLPLPSF